MPLSHSNTVLFVGLLLLGSAALVPASISAQCTPAWDLALGTPGADGPVFATTIYNDGTGPALYVGGAFTSIGGISAPSQLARFDGTTWTAVGVGTISGGAVRALTVFDDGSGPRLFVGGQFFGTGGSFIALVASFDGTTWSDLAGGMEGAIVNDFAVFDPGTGPRLYAGGSFNSAGGEFAEGLASWNGTSWFAAGNGAVNGDVFALHTHDLGDGAGPSLYVGGPFSSVGSVSATNIARHDGTTFFPLDVGVNNTVWSLASFGSTLVVGGDFTSAGIVPSPHLAGWDGLGWLDITPGGGGANATVFALESDVDFDGVPRLVFGGTFTTVGGVAASHIATLSGAGISPLGLGTDDDVRAFASHSGGGALAGGLYVGGLFTTAEGATASRLARYETCPVMNDPLFERGDTNSDGSVNIADAIYELNALFTPGVFFPCAEALDVNDDGGNNIADAIYLLAFLFQPNSPAPAPPFGTCGADLDGDAVSCDDSNPAC